MFGTESSSSYYEGRIDRDGSFSIRGNMPGVRHIFVVGRGNQPLKVFAFDVTRAAANDTGDIDLSRTCPRMWHPRGVEKKLLPVPVTGSDTPGFVVYNGYPLSRRGD